VKKPKRDPKLVAFVETLFTDPCDRKVLRLAIVVDEDKPAKLLSGWCREAICDRIAEFIETSPPHPQPAARPQGGSMTSISHLKALANKASPAPWKVRIWTEGHTTGQVLSASGACIASVHDRKSDVEAVANQELIVALRNSFAAMSEVVEAAEAWDVGAATATDEEGLRLTMNLINALARFRSAGEGA
jgi:hypothetical protein